MFKIDISNIYPFIDNNLYNHIIQYFNHFNIIISINENFLIINDTVCDINEHNTSFIDTYYLEQFSKYFSNFYSKFNNYNLYLLLTTSTSFKIIQNNIIFVDFNNFLINYNKSNNFITLNKPITDFTFSTPEIKNISYLPYNIHYNTFPYSFASFLLHLIKNYSSDKKIYNNIQSFYPTSFYSFLHRCLHNNPQDRYLLFI
jgi:hypothetical protein